MSAKKNANVATRISNELRQRLDRIHSRHLTNDSAVLQALLTSFCDAAEQAAAVRWPVTLTMADEQFFEAAEDPAPYPANFIPPSEAAAMNLLSQRVEKSTAGKRK